MATITNDINWRQSRPINPFEGDCYFDLNTYISWIYVNGSWVQFSGPVDDKPLIPTQKTLDEYPTLKEAWEYYLVVKKLLGV